MITKKNWMGLAGIAMTFIIGIWLGGLSYDILYPNWRVVAMDLTIVISAMAFIIYFLSCAFED